MSSEPTPATPRRRGNRDRLIDTAARLFHDEGYAHVSMDQILADSGVVKSNFYYHFKGKQELALAVLDVWIESLAEEVIAPIRADTNLTALERVRHIVEALIDRLEGHGCRAGCPFGSLANSEAEHNEVFRARLVEVFDGFTQILTELYTDAVAAGQVSAAAPPPGPLAAATLSFVQGGYLLSKTYTDAAKMREAAGAWFDLIAAR